MKPPNEFSVFYARLQNIRAYHKKAPNEAAQPMVIEFARKRAKTDKKRKDGEVDLEEAKSIAKRMSLSVGPVV